MNRRVRWLVVWVTGVLLLGGCSSGKIRSDETRQGSPFANVRTIDRTPATAPAPENSVTTPATAPSVNVTPSTTIDESAAGPMGEQPAATQSAGNVEATEKTEPVATVASAAVTAPKSATPALQAVAPIAARDMLQLRARQETMAITQGKLEGEQTTYQVIPRGKDSYSLHDPKGTTTHLYLGTGGDVLVTSEEDLEENVIVEYDPALRLLPTQLVQGQVATDSAHMSVYNRRTKKLRDQGTIDVDVELIGRQNMRTPAGEFTVDVVRTTRRIKLNLAEATVVTFSAYAPGRGLVAERTEQNTKAIGIFNGTKTNEMRLSK